MKKDKISEANLILTDKVMKKVYNENTIQIEKCNIIDYDDLELLNLYSTQNQIQNFGKRLKDCFFLIAGSSNFHHIDIANLKRLENKTEKKIQLILLDSHMDALKYIIKSDFIHCGNWVSYAYRYNLINKVLMIGTGDWRGNKSFDHSLVKNNDLLYHPDLNKTFKTEFLDPESPTYISIDTDIINNPSDWGIGRCDFNEILKSPFWNQLSDINLIGATIMGHVTDNRRTLDLIKSSLRRKEKTKNHYHKKEKNIFLKNSIRLKLPASLTTYNLSIDQQFEIVLKFYQKIQSII